MKWQEWLEKWSMTSLKIKVSYLEMEWHPKDKDKDAAWEMYIEILTRITTQPLASGDGDEKTALESIYKIFNLTRETIKHHGRDCIEFTKIAVVVLNQIIRPFTSKWHASVLKNDFSTGDRKRFREELSILQGKLRIYTKMLAEMAGVEDLTELEKE